MSHIKRIGVLRGGPSSEYEVSLHTGLNVLKVLREYFEHKYQAHDILIDRSGNWHIDGMPIISHEVFPKIDIAFNALHGAYGEDGKIQHILETHGIPFTGSGSLASAVGMNKSLSKKVFVNHGIKTPYYKVIASSRIKRDMDQVMKELFRSSILPVIVKPCSSGSSMSVTVIRKYSDFPQALDMASEHGHEVMIEEFIPGIEATCGIVEDFRGHSLYALPPIEIRHNSGLFDYEAKYGGKSQEIVPAEFSHELKAKIEDLARQIHQTLNLRHYSRSDFIIHPKRGIYVLEVNTLPGLTEESLIPKALHAVGSNVREFVGHVLGLL